MPDDVSADVLRHTSVLQECRYGAPYGVEHMFGSEPQRGLEAPEAFAYCRTAIPVLVC